MCYIQKEKKAKKNDEGLTILLENGNSWFSSTNNNNETDKKKYIKKKDDVVYKIFEDAADLVEDEFWKTMLLNASKSKFKRGFKFNNGVLTYKIKNKIFSFNLNLNSPIELKESFIYFIKEKCGILSNDDKVNKTEEIGKLYLNKNDEILKSWSKIKTNTHKHIIINKYIQNIKKQDNLDDNKYLHLKDKIVTGIILGIFNSKTIIIENGEIIEIIGLIKNEYGNYIYDENVIKNKTQSNYKNDYTLDTTLDTIIENEPQKDQQPKLTYNKILKDFFDKYQKNIKQKKY